MGCDIHSVAIDASGKVIEGGKWADGESANPDKEYMKGWGEGEPFGWRNYGVFAFLAGVRNYSGVKPIADPRGVPFDLQRPDDLEDPEFWLGDHSESWLSLAELEAFDYDAIMIDRRSTQHFFREDGSYAGSDGSFTLPENVGKSETWRDFLGKEFFNDLAELRRIGADRVVFGFDN